MTGQGKSRWLRFWTWLFSTDCAACHAERARRNNPGAECDACWNDRIIK